MSASLEVTPLMEQMAIAVLRGDVAAAHALADELVGSINRDERYLPPVKRITCDPKNLRIIVSLRENNKPDRATRTQIIGEIQNTMLSWLTAGDDSPRTKIAVGWGIDHLEMYEIAPNGG